MFKKILIFSIVFVLCAIISTTCFATGSSLTLFSNNSVSDNSMRNTTANNTVDNNLTIGSSTTTSIDNTTYSQNTNQSEPDSTLLNSNEVATLTATDNYEDSGELSISNIINIILIVVGIVLILLGIAIVIKIK